MRHNKRTCKLGRNSSHRRCLFANLLKSLVVHGKVVTTVAKAKELKRLADRLITVAKKDTLDARRRVKAKLMIRYNKLTPKEARAVKAGNQESYNDDRKVMDILFGDLKNRFTDRQGGYCRILRTGMRRHGDRAERCIIEFLP